MGPLGILSLRISGVQELRKQELNESGNKNYCYRKNYIPQKGGGHPDKII